MKKIIVLIYIISQRYQTFILAITLTLKYYLHQTTQKKTLELTKIYSVRTRTHTHTTYTLIAYKKQIN